MSSAEKEVDRAGAERDPVNIVVIPHSHWDREWYATFEEFRFYLVHFMDELTELLEEDEGFRSFMLDGQASLLEDYLEVRPEKRELLRSLVREGRLEIGPWYVQPDEFLISGEALVRNLMLGDRVAKDFGPVMKQGYVPDTFGHVNQLPQILRGFDIGTFYFMRGIGEEVSELGAEFWWEAPDGSKVAAHFLSETYSNAALLGSDPSRISFRHDRLADPSSYLVSYDSLYELRDRLAGRSSSGVILLMNGSDHVTVQPNFSKYIFDLNQTMPDRVFNGKLSDFERLVLEGNNGLKTYSGELRSARYQPILKGTYSSRNYIKQYNERTQRLLEGKAERAAAVVYALGGRDYSPFLKYAWRELIKNHAHDSIGGCSADAVHRQMIGRFETATRVGEKVVEECLDYLSTRVAPAPRPDMIPIVVFNPSPWERGGRVQVEVSVDVDVPLGRRIFDWIGQKKLDLKQSLLVDPKERPVSFAAKGETLHIEDALYRRKAVQRATLEFEATGVPPLGYKVYRLIASEGDEESEQEEKPPWDAALENENLRVSVEDDFTLRIVEKNSGEVYSGLNLFVDEGEAGDEYTFSPPREQGRFLSSEADWRIEAGEYADTMLLRGVIRLPRSLSSDRNSRSDDLVRCPVKVVLRLPPGSRRVEVQTEFYNRARDHRLRVAFPSGVEAGESVAETAFGTVKRPTKPADSTGWREEDTASYAQQRFVCVDDGSRGLAVFNKGLPEYEVTPDGEIKLTLVRSVGWLSRNDLATRRGHAGPELATPEAQCAGRQVFEYAVMPYEGSWEEAGLFREAEEYCLPLEAGAAQQREEEAQPSPEGAPGFFLKIGGRGVVLSSLKKAADRDGLVLRVFNTSETETTARLRFGLPVSVAYKTNLNEEILEGLAPRGNRLDVSLGPARVETILIRLHQPEKWVERVKKASRGE